jgi:hypothetical protein
MDIEFWKILIQQGAGIAALTLVVFFFYRLAIRFGQPFIDAQAAQAAAMQNQAESLKEMKDCFVGYISKDNNDHREILLGLQVVIAEVQKVNAQVKIQKELMEGICSDAGKKETGKPIQREL